MHLQSSSSFRSTAVPFISACVFIVGFPALIGTAVYSAQDAGHRISLPDYRIVARDELKFQVTGETDDPLIERVSTAGEISIPLLGAFKAAGLTLREQA